MTPGGDPGIREETEKLKYVKWLNNDFLRWAFTEEEQKLIQTVTWSAETQDKIFLLTNSEARKYFSSDTARKCTPIGYAASSLPYRGAEIRLTGPVFWWLRYPSSDSFAATVTLSGRVDDHGEYSFGSPVSNEETGVRPALWIGLTP